MRFRFLVGGTVFTCVTTLGLQTIVGRLEDGDEAHTHAEEYAPLNAYGHAAINVPSTMTANIFYRATW